MLESHRSLRVTAVFFILSVLFLTPLCGQQTSPQALFVNAHAAQEIHLKPFFERNDGQLDGSVLYQVHGLGYSAFLTRDGATLFLSPDSSSPSGTVLNRSTIHLKFVGTNPRAEVIGLDKFASYSNYFSGSDPAKWHTRVPQYYQVQYKNIYPGIDLVFYIRENRLEYDFTLAPGANPRNIKMEIDGARIRLTHDGDVQFGEGPQSLMKLLKPQAHEMNRRVHDVPVSYIVHQNDIRLKVAEYDPKDTLVIDPALEFATFLTSGLNGCDIIRDIAADGTGVYVSGLTCANSFPFDPRGPVPAKSASPRAFVTKLDPTGVRAIFTSFITEAGPPALAVDSSGAVYLAGEVTNPDASFPVTTGAYNTTLCQHFGFNFRDQCTLPYAAKLSADGATLLYSTFLQGASGDPAATPFPHIQQLIQVEKIAVDDLGALYMTGEAVGQTGTNVLNLQVPVGSFQTSPGLLFALKLNPTGSALQYSTYLDGASTGVSAGGIDVDSSHAAYVAGSASAGYPTTPGALLTSDPAAGLQSTTGDVAAFVTKLSADGASEIYSTYVDPLGAGTSTSKSLAVDPSGQVIIGGSAASPVPKAATFQFAAFMTKLNATGTAVVYSDQLSINNSRADVIDAVKVDSLGAAYGVGFSSDAATFTLLNPIQGYPLASPGQEDAIAVKIDPAGALQWSTFLGVGAVPTLAQAESAGVALDGTGNAYLLLTVDGLTGTQGSLDPQQPGFPSYMLFKIVPNLGAPVALVVPGSLTFPATVVGTSSVSGDVRIGNYGDAGLSAPVISITGPFSETDNCSAGVPAGQKCDIAVIFKPLASGAQSGSLVLNFGAQSPAQTVQLSGTAISPNVSLAPASLTFQSQALNISSAAQSVVVTNTGTAPLSISSLQITGDFSQTNGCGPAVAPGSSCTVQVVFTPTALGSRTGTLTITDNAPGSPHTLSLSGTGAAPNLGLKLAGTGTASVVAGGTASFPLSIGGQGINGTATLTCTGAPIAATCSVPNTITLNSTSATNFTVTTATTGRSVALLHPQGAGRPPKFWAIGLVAIVLPLVRQVRTMKKRPALLLAIIFAALLSLCSCGGGSGAGAGPQGTPAGTYNLTVTAVSGTTTESIAVTLTVQ